MPGRRKETRRHLIQTLALKNMFNAILIAAAAGIIFSLLMKLVLWTREREIDESGNPILRYLVPPYEMILIGLIFLTVSIYQWLDPTNHRYSGNLLLLAYIPASVSFACFCMATYFWKFRATLRNNTIEHKHWPFPAKKYKLEELESLETKGKNTLLKFSQNRKFSVNIMLSGREYFVEKIKR